MITCDLTGRLGNQMFQLATTMCHAEKLQRDFCLPEKKERFTNIPCCEDLPAGIQLYIESSHAFQQLPNIDNLRLRGFFQSEKYFKACRDRIITVFGLHWEMIPDTVSIHVRRGDYLQYKDKHPPVTTEYITDAIEYMFIRGYRRFIIFSDDLSYCKKQFQLIGGLLQECAFEFSEGLNEKDDLQRMSCCEHNIIANSTFSWWAAWLNQNPYKIVIAPKQWFGPGNKHLPDTDIVPENWIRL